MKQTNKVNTTLIYALAVSVLTSCTGYNLAVSFGGAIPNTNPAREYANGATMYKGGMFFHKNTVPGQTGVPNAKCIKKGVSCSHSILWLAAFGDSSIDSAKADKDIKSVCSVDHEVMGILGFVYHRHCTTVLGE